MREAAIIGAGELGGALTVALARAEVAGVLRLVDEAGQIAAGKALDVMQSSPLDRFSTNVTGSADLLAASGADLVVVADRADGGGEWRGEEGLTLLRRLPLAPGAIVVCAGAMQRELVEKAVRELGFRRERVLGSAPEALAAAVRAIVALEADASPGDVAVTLAGIPPDRLMIPWDAAAVDGYAAERMLDEPARRRVAARLPALWPPGPLALAAAAARIAVALAGRSRRSASCFVAPDDRSGRRARTVALPVRLTPRGIGRVLVPELSPRDRVALDNAMLL